jgi:DNA-directed RNA polymerase specialized sigma24 family protein
MPHHQELKRQFDEMFRAQAPGVYAFCYQVLQDRDEAHLVAGNFWKRLYSRIPEFELPTDRMLFMRLVAREIVEFLHYEKPADPSDRPDPEELRRLDWSEVEMSEIETRQHQVRAREVLRKLLPRQRLALILHYRFACNSGDIAKVLSCTIDSARAYLHSALIAYSNLMRTMEQNR